MQWVLWNLSQKDLSPGNASSQNYVSHRLSPTYVPDKDEVQEEVAKLRNLKIKTTLKKDTTLNFLVWHKNGTQ